MGLEDDFLKDDLDDEKTIEYIKNYLPQELKEKFSRKIDHIIYIGFGKNVRYQFSIAYVPLHEPHSRIGYFVFNSTQIPGIRKFV